MRKFNLFTYFTCCALLSATMFGISTLQSKAQSKTQPAPQGNIATLPSGQNIRPHSPYRVLFATPATLQNKCNQLFNSGCVITGILSNPDQSRFVVIGVRNS